MVHDGSLAIVFAGSPEFAVPTLEALDASSHSIVGVYCQPDRPAGRGLKLRACAVKQYAREHALAVHQPESLRDPEAQATLASLRPDVVVVSAYGLLLPPAVLAIPRHGCLNVHASLLPRWRGAAPIQRAILAGDRESGVSIMLLDAGLDTGPVYLRAVQPIGPETTAGELHDELATLGAATLLECLDAIVAGKLLAQAQTEKGATYAAKIVKEEAFIDWGQPAEQIARQVRAFNPWPGAETRSGDRRLKIWAAHALEQSSAEAPGRVVDEGRAGITVACGQGQLQITRVQLGGRRAVDAAAFVNAERLKGTRLQ